MASASSPLPVCVVGYGGSSRTFHIPYLLAMPEAFTLHSIQQRPGSTSGPPASKDHPTALVLGSFDEVLTTLPKPGLIVISTSNATHYPFARRALEAGYHVVCEKPITWRHAEALDLARLAKEHGLVCASFNNRRWDGDFLTVQSLLQPPASQPDQPSALGEATYYESRFDRFRPWSKGGWREEAGFDEGGGLLLDLGSHLGDQLLTLFGPPATITAFVRNQRGQLAPKVDDDFMILADYPASPHPLPPSSPGSGTRLGSGMRALLGATCLATHVDGEQPRFRVEGTKGSYEKRGVDPQEAQLKAGRKPCDPKDEGFGVYSAEDPDSMKLGRLTTSSDAGQEAMPAPAAGGGKATAPVQPKLATSDVPTLPGRYDIYWQNVCDAVRAAEGARAQGGADVYAAVQKTLYVKPEQAADCIKLLCLARKSSVEGRTVKWDEEA